MAWPQRYDADAPNEKEAIHIALSLLLDEKWNGDNDFDKGMRTLQQAMGIKR